MADLTQGRPAELDKPPENALAPLQKRRTHRQIARNYAAARPRRFKPRGCSFVGQGSAANLTPPPCVKLLAPPCAIEGSCRPQGCLPGARRRCTDAIAQAVTEALLSPISNRQYKLTRKNDKFIELLQSQDSATPKKLREKGIAHGRIIAKRRNFTRDLVNEPSNKRRRKFSPKKPTHGQGSRPCRRNPR